MHMESMSFLGSYIILGVTLAVWLSQWIEGNWFYMIQIEINNIKCHFAITIYLNLEKKIY